MELRDPEIREQLRAGLVQRVTGQRHTQVVDELGILLGQVRADVAVIGPDEFVGYEIKSDFDSLTRLARQVEAYDMVFDRSYLICGNKYIAKAKAAIPDHWGLYTLTALRVLTGSEVNRYAYKLKFSKVRDAQANPEVDPFARAQLLRTGEMLDELRLRGMSRGQEGADRLMLAQVLADSFSDEQVRQIVARRLALRTNWRADADE